MGTVPKFFEGGYNMSSEKKNLTIKDISKLSGVSRSTVSRVLTGSTKVKASTRKKIEEVINETNYSPSPLAQGLVKGNLNIIALLIGDIKNPFYSEIAKLVEAVAHKAGYMVVLCDTDYNFEKELMYLTTVQKNNFAGLIMMTVLNSEELTSVLNKIHCPIVMLNRYNPSFNGDVVIVNNYQGGYEVGKYLAALGHTSIGFLSGPENSTASQNRSNGFLQAMNDYNITLAEENIMHGDLRMESGLVYAERWLNNKIKPSAVFAANDLMALGLMKRLQEEEIDIPKDVSIVGYDDLPVSGIKSVSLTTVQQPHYKMGEVATNMLLERINQNDEPSRKIVFEPKLIIRDTTKKI